MFIVIVDDHDAEWQVEAFCDLEDAATYGYHRLQAHDALRFDLLDSEGRVLLGNVHRARYHAAVEYLTWQRF